MRVDYAELLHRRLEAAFREDPGLGLRWAGSQIAVHQLMAELKSRGWNQQERAHALQALLRSIVAQAEHFEQEAEP